MSGKSLTINTATIGPASWRNETMKTIKLSQTHADRSDKSIHAGQTLDPLPNLRDTLADLSNNEAHSHFRNVRSVVSTLRSAVLELNDEIKALTRGKEALEKAHEHIRKDIKLNEESQQKRTERPQKEKSHDGADDLLQAEKLHLLNLKKGLERHLHAVKQQLQVLDAARRRVTNVCQERNRVLDLICHVTPVLTNASAPAKQRQYSGRNTPTSRCATMPVVDPLGAYTPEVDKALQEARDAKGASMNLRKNILEGMERTDKMQKAAHQSVNSGITQKIGETVSLKQQLHMAFGDNRHALNRAQRWYDSTEASFAYQKGPNSSYDLMCKERMNRPVQRVFQRHPGNQMPEVQELIKGSDGLLDSLTATSRNIGILKLARLRLNEDMRNKKAAMDIDASILRDRRARADHRWTLGRSK